jgi:hypothetical protein
VKVNALEVENILLKKWLFYILFSNSNFKTV